MLHILLFILIFFFVILILIFSVFRGVISFLLKGFFPKKFASHQNYNRGDQQNNRQQNEYSNNSNKKVFSSEEGEYVKYEEIE